MLYVYRFRLCPDESNEVLIQKHFGCCRFIYNYLLWYRQLMYEKTGESVSWGDSQGVIAKLKKYEEYSWLKDVNSQSLQFSHSCLRIAYENFFEHRAGFPKRKKDLVRSFTIPQNVRLEKLDDRYSMLYIPKFRNGIKVRTHRELEGEIRSASIVQEPSGEYYVNILTSRESFKRYPKIEGEAGVDLGLTAFLVKDNGEKVPAPRYLRVMEKKLVRAQQRLSKKRKGSKNYEKMRREVAILHQKIKNRRKDFLHQESARLIRENQVIYLEDLCVKGMMQNHCLAKSIADAGWSTFVRYILYKADWHGREVVKVDRFAPTSKMCSSCGRINKELKLGDRVWRCKICHAEHDRDINAAKNIKKLGQDRPKVKPEESTTDVSTQRGNKSAPGARNYSSSNSDY